MNPYDLVGKKLGDYKIERKIATGGMATIYLGIDEKLGRQAAVKVLTPDVSDRDETLTQRFEREARAIGQLEHENIIPIYQFGQQENLYFLAMRYIAGEDLGDVIDAFHKNNQLMPFERVLFILDQVASALDYAHSKGIVHRDVKPSNILLANNDKAYLSDFGLVLYQTGDQTLGTAFGTPRYISPEQATDSQLATSQSDIYSLAVIVYELVTGQRLFKGKTPMEVALSHITETPLPPRAINAKLSPNVQSVILRSLEKEPEKRHLTAKAFIDDLRDAYMLGGDVPHPSTDPTLLDVPDGEIGFSATLPLKPTSIPSFETDKLTMAVRAEAAIPTSKLSAKASVASSESAKPAEATRKPNVAVIAGIIALIAVVGIGVLMATRGNNSATTATQAATAETTTQNVVSGALQLRYTDSILAIMNTSDASLSLSNLVLAGSGSDDTFNNSSGNLEATLAPKSCVLLKAGTPNIAIPADWGCSETGALTLNTSKLAWRADATSDTTFTLSLGDKTATCDTVGRAVNRFDEGACGLN